jgi:hypothetical protein
MKSLIRTKKTPLEKTIDHVETHPFMIDALADWIKENIPEYKHLKVLDPCSGENGRIWKGLKNVFYNITYFDRYFGKKRGNFLLHKNNYDVITFNPPYSNKYKFVKKARKQARYVFALIPHVASNYLCIQKEWQDVPEYVGIIKMSPKFDLSKNKRGGNTMYCWFIWDSENNTKTGLTWFDDLDLRGEM